MKKQLMAFAAALLAGAAAAETAVVNGITWTYTIRGIGRIGRRGFDNLEISYRCGNEKSDFCRKERKERKGFLNFAAHNI